MSLDGIFAIGLILAAFLCSLVAGFLLAFALAVMPGITSLDDREFIQAFQVMDRVIQNRQPVFVVVWVGSAVALLAVAVVSIGQLDGTGRLLMILAVLAYFLGVQLLTGAINIPLNNRLQALDVDAMSETERNAARKDFEPRWNRWNTIRTAFASLASVLLMFLLFTL
jgi:uncharacterized membrane protein